MKRIYLMRHGQTQSNVDKVYAGWSDEALTARGEEDIARLRPRLTELGLEKIFSSPIRRAVQTAEIVNSALGIEIEISPDLIELKMGPWEGLPEREIITRYPEDWRLWNRYPSRLRLEGRETLDDLTARGLRAIEAIRSEPALNTALAVTHVALIRVLMIHFNGIPKDDYRTIDIPNGSVFRLENDEFSSQISRYL